MMACKSARDGNVPSPGQMPEVRIARKAKRMAIDKKLSQGYSVNFI